MASSNSSQLSAEWLDKLTIRELLERYMRYDDDRDLDGIIALFHPEATYQVMGRVLKGTHEIREFLAESVHFVPGKAHWAQPGGLFLETATTHISSNPVIELHGDEALVETDFLVARREENGRAKISLLGRYRDQLRRDSDGTWRFFVRTGVSVDRKGYGGTDTEWQKALDRTSAVDRSRLITEYSLGQEKA